MTVKELREALERHCEMRTGADESNVSIPVTAPGPSIGGSPAVSVKDVGCGMDWDAGQFFVYPQEELYVNQEKLKAEARVLDQIRDILYMMQLDKTRQKNGNALMLMREAFEEAGMPIPKNP